MLFYASKIMWLAASTLWSFAFVVASAPWVPVILKRRPDFPEWIALSIALGYTASMAIGWLAVVGGFVIAFVGLASIAVIGAVLVGWSWPRLSAAADPFGRGAAMLSIVAILVSLAPRVVFQLRVGAWPRGWDPMMHLTIVRAMQLQRGVPWTLQPIDDAAVNYPWGSHFAIAAQSALSGEYPHAVFAAQNSVFLSVATMAAVLLFAWRSLADRRSAICSLVVYANVMHFGGADYQNWGGLPNHAGSAS